MDMMADLTSAIGLVFSSAATFGEAMCHSRYDFGCLGRATGNVYEVIEGFESPR